MQSPTNSNSVNEATLLTSTRKVITEPDFSGTPQPIDEFAGRADFPQCALGAYIDIQGFAGVVVEIVKESIKVRSPEGLAQRFNANRLKTLYGPAVRPEPMVQVASISREQPDITVEAEAEKPEAPSREFVANPDFSAPVRPIRFYATQADFPKCAYGKHVDIQGYSGVVVELVKGSLKIQSPEGITRSYNAEVMKKLYGKD
jgi:hypothetical protein